MNTNHATSRRSFLLQAGAASAAAGAFDIVSAQSVRGSQANSAISVALIGSGSRGTVDAGIFQGDARAKITALCDIFPDQIEKARIELKLDKPKTFDDFEKVLADPGIDAVIIATPPFEHPRMFEAAAQSKKHVYLEKPMGVDVAGCKRLLAASKKVDPSKTIAVGMQARYSPEYLEAYKRLKAGAIGELLTARGGIQIMPDVFKKRDVINPKEEHIRNWFCYKDYSGDIIVEQNCHNIDVIGWFLGGPPVSAVGHSVRKFRKTWETMDNFTVVFRWPDDVLVNYEGNQLTPHGYIKSGEEFVGDKGLLLTTRMGMTQINGPQERTEIKSKREITIDAVENFLERIVTNNPENAISRATRSTCIGLLATEAVYTGREVTWKSLGVDV